MPKNSAGTTIVSLKVTLRGTKPPIWRRLLMPDTMTLDDLHQAIQAALGWDDCHLHAFDIDGRQYGDRQTVDDVADENRLTLKGLLKCGVARFAYTYDFGDNWEHTVAIEKPGPRSTGRPIRSASPGNAPVHQKIAADPEFWPIRTIPTMPTRRSGSTKTSPQTTSTLLPPMPSWPRDSSEGDPEGEPSGGKRA